MRAIGGRAKGGFPPADVDASRPLEVTVVAEAMMKQLMPANQICEVLRAAGAVTPSGGAKRKQIERQYHLASQRDTPYGAIATTVPLTLADGTAVDAYVNSPFALMYAAAKANDEYGRFLLAHVRHGAKIVIYHDETVPGNNMRPDKGRSYEQLSWTFAELPDWYRARKHGFFKFGYVFSDIVDQLRGGMIEKGFPPRRYKPKARSAGFGEDSPRCYSDRRWFPPLL